MKRVVSFIIIAGLIAIAALPAGSAAKDGTMPLRVCVIDGKGRVYLMVKGPYKIYALDSDRMIMEGPRLREYVKVSKKGLIIGRKETELDGVTVKAARGSDVYVDSRRFRGSINIVKRDDGRINVVNNIGLEDYLYGVLYHEVSHRWPMEVLKAQAIAARTFAVYQAKNNKLQPYDLRSDIYSQVYGGRTSEKWATTRAVDLTRNQVLAYNGEILPSYYHAACGGYAEDASNLWNVDLPPLKGVSCGSCGHSPHYKWTKEMPLWQVEAKLRDSGYKVGRIKTIDILSKNRSGRVDKIEIKDEAGNSAVLTGKDFRHILGPNELRSTKFDAAIKWRHAVFHGYGWGHGVGMCQWGAFGMARRHKKAEEILQHYYPGSELTTIDKLK